MPTQCTPALNQAVKLPSSGSTSPLGIILVQGQGPLTALTNSGPPTCFPGNILTTSAPSSSALEISVTEPQPGDHKIFLLLQTTATSSFNSGDTIKSAPHCM